MTDKKNEAFHQEMLLIYDKAKQECNYNASRFRKMVVEHGGFETAKIPDGFYELWEAKKLNLTMEALMIQNEWRELFTATEIQIAEKRLRDFGYKFD